MSASEVGSKIAIVLVILALVAIIVFQPQSRLIGLPVRPLVIEQHFNIANADIVDFDITQMKGQVILVDFWATWCQECVQSVPHLKKIHQDYSDKGLVLIGYTDQTSINLDKFIRSYQIDYPIFVGPSANTYEIRSVPQLVLIDKQGIIRKVAHPAHISYAEIEKLLAE
ncbi:MAG: redoxin domain-containing protein [Planctomycetes bacterium]|nr:redoxin domain-containing protein [Planctomycetota bacterium]